MKNVTEIKAADTLEIVYEPIQFVRADILATEILLQLLSGPREVNLPVIA